MDDNEAAEIIKDFLIESNENLSHLEQELVDLEKRPKDKALLGSIFRTFHTIKGTCGFLHFTTLESVTHGAENLLNQLRNGEKDLSPELVSLVLTTVDTIKTILGIIETTNAEGPDNYAELRRALTAACEPRQAPPAAAAAPPTSGAPPPAPAAPPPAAPPSPVPATVAPATPVAVAPTEAAPKKSGSTETARAQADHSPRSEPASQGDGESGNGPRTAVADSTIRVDVGLLDNLMNLVGELVLVRNQILQAHAQHDEAGMYATTQRLNLITTQVQERVMKTRMQPIGMVWNKLPRVVRDLAVACGKQVQVEMDGADTELDKSIIESIKDPLTHIVRNSCDHGIELPAVRLAHGKPAQGRLQLRAFHEGGQVNIEISDDGGGIELEKLKAKALQRGLITPEQADRMTEREATNLIFMPGLSTAEKVTNISGRGVGMDVVRTNIERIGGTVDLASRLGEGTTVKIRIPLTLAIIPGLIVEGGDERFVIPQVSLLELIRLEGEAERRQIERINGTPVYRRRGQLLPIAYLDSVLRTSSDRRSSDVVNIVVLQAEDRQFGLVVDIIHDTEEIVVKPLAKQLKSLDCYSGATIMGDGRVALILDVVGLGQLSGVLTEVHEQARAEASHEDVSTTLGRQTFLVVKAGSFDRLAVPLSVVARLEEFALSRIEQASGQLVVQYRDQILPLVHVTKVIDPGASLEYGAVDPLQVVVFADGPHMVGAIVDQVIDIIEDVVTIRQHSGQHGIVGSAVIAQKVTDFLDVEAVIAAARQDWFGETASAAARGTVMLAEQSPVVRGLLRTHLEMAGHAVVEAASETEAVTALEQSHVDLVVVDVDLDADGAHTLLRHMRGSRELAAIPTLGLGRSSNGHGRSAHANGNGHNGNGHDRAAADLHFDEYQTMSDRDSLLATIERMLHAPHATDEALTLTGQPS